jgi:hypothetical protein
MHIDGNMPGEGIEVGVRCEYPHPVTHSHGAEQQICRGALNAFAAADVVKAGRVLVVFLVRHEVGVKAQLLLELVKSLLRLRAGQQFLPDGAEHLDGVGANKFGHFGADRVVSWAVAAEKVCPDAGVNDDFHRLPRSFL